jgi:hypothetical protein
MTKRRTSARSKIAILVPGQLRCLEFSYPHFKSWSKGADLFVLTNRTYTEQARAVAELGASCRFVEDRPQLAEQEASISTAQLTQWLKLRACIDMLWEVERERNHRYDYIIKMRTDYVLAAPDALLDMDMEATNNCIYANTDVCFSGRREFVLPLHGLYMAGLTTFYKRSDQYFAINPDHILECDATSCKWFLARFPRDLVDLSPFNRGTPSAELLQSIKNNRDKIVNYVHGSGNELVPDTTGCRDFASELVFFYYMNFLGIPIKSHRKLTGHVVRTRYWPTQPRNARHLFEEVLPELLDTRRDSCEENGAIAFHITGEFGGEWRVNFHDGRATVAAGGGEAACSVWVRDSDFMDLVLGARPMRGFAEWLKATGDVRYLERLRASLGHAQPLPPRSSSSTADEEIASGQ